MSAGTAPFNFPPENFVEIGRVLTGASLRNTAALPNTVMFTAPTSGIYGLNVAVHIVSTDGAGSYTVTFTPPYGGGSSVGKNVTLDVQNTAIVWLNRGDQMLVSTTTTGFTGTVYDVYLVMRRLF